LGRGKKGVGVHRNQDSRQKKNGGALLWDRGHQKGLRQLVATRLYKRLTGGALERLGGCAG